MRCAAFSLKSSVVWKYGMEYERKSLWNEILNGKFLIWNGNGMDENCHYRTGRNHLPFHIMRGCSEKAVTPT